MHSASTDPETNRWQQWQETLAANEFFCREALDLVWGGLGGRQQEFQLGHRPPTSTVARALQYAKRHGEVPRGLRKILARKLARKAWLLEAGGMSLPETGIGGDILPVQTPYRRLERLGKGLPLSEHSLTFRPFQRAGVAFIEVCGGRAYIADEMGLGKTVQALGWLALHPAARPAVVVCPAHLKTNWLRETKRLLPDEQIEILSGTNPCPIPHTAGVLIINYEILISRSSPHWVDALVKARPQTVILDEAHYAKNYKSKRTKACRALARVSPALIMLSGTPMDNHPIDLYNPIQMLRPGTFPGWQAYVDRYCVQRNGWLTKGARNLDDLHRRLDRVVMLRRKKADVLKELPPKEKIIVPVDMQDPSRYAAAEGDFISWLAEQDIERAEKAAEAGQLAEIGELRKLIMEQKTPAVLQWIADFLESSSGKLITFSHHIAMWKAVKAQFPEALVVAGAQSGKQKQEAVDLFQTDPKKRLLVANIVAAGTGYNLTAAADCVHLELMFKPSLHLQAEDRIHRIGQTADRVRSWYLVAAGSIEEDLIKMLDIKTQQQSQALDGKKISRAHYLRTLLRNAQKRRTGTR